MENVYDDFNKFYKDEKGGDKDIIEKILQEIKEYDIYDFISKLVALNLVPENQNKATIIEPVIAAMLTLNKDEIASKYKVSIGRFKKILKSIEEMKLVSAIDPPENAFIDRVMFYKNYNIFTGINYIPGYILQSIIDTIHINTNKLNPEFVKKTSILIVFILEISNNISEKIGISIENLKQYDQISSIIVPNKNELEKYQECLIIKEKEINIMLNDKELIDLLYSEFENDNFEEILNIENQKFFRKPFLKDGSGNVIILSPSLIIPFLIHNIIILAQKYKEKDKFIQLYNNYVWNKCTCYFDKLRNRKIDEYSLGVKLKNDNAYKEMLLTGDNKQVIITIGIFDDGRSIDKEKIFDSYKNDDINKLIDERINYIINKLKYTIQDGDIFVCAVYNSFGRGMLTKLNHKNIVNNPICLNPFELKCIAINEKNQKFFLTRYMNAKNKLIQMPQFFGELPFINTYVNCDYSFYINDEFNPKNTLLYIAPEDDIEYIVKSLRTEDRHLVKLYNSEYIGEVILVDEKRRIYTTDCIDENNIIVNLLLEMENIRIWIYSEKVNDTYELNIYHNIIDAISYWISENKKIFESNVFEENDIRIKIAITGNSIEYFYNEAYNDTVESTISIEKRDNIIKLNISPETYHCFNRNDNKEEKNLLTIILRTILNITDNDYKLIDKTFEPSNKQKFFVIDYENYPYLKPLTFPQNRKINENDSNELLDDVGNYIISLGKWGYGIVNENEKNQITFLVVDYLYKLLQSKVKNINANILIRQIYLDLEEKIYCMMMFQKRYYYDILCYPEKKDKIWKEFNEDQKCMKAMKFLIEYVAAQPSPNNGILGECEYEQLLAICSLIVEWAYNNDLFRYKIFNTPIEILRSDRIGMKKDEFDMMGKSLLKARMREFEYSSIGKWNDLIVKNSFESSDLDEAFDYENGFTFSDFLKVCYSLIIIGDEQSDEVKTSECEMLVSKIKEQLSDVNEKKIYKILEYISLEKREDFLVPPVGYRKEDVYPWRFNRELSFTRRPLIKNDKQYFWGNRNIFHMAMFTLDLINDGKFKTKSKEMTEYIGKISDDRGKAFNESVFNILKKFPELTVDKNLKKINKKRIVDKNNNDLGDIDVLYIYKRNKQIVVGEVKDFKLSRNPYEIFCEYREMFEDTAKKKSYSTKLKKRAEWVEQNIEDVKQYYNLEGNDWKVYKVFIVNEHLVSNNVYSKNENIISISEISLRNLTNLKSFSHD